ncbi:MAG: NYN domain-containing protein [Gemmatimonadaceae bacterium]
MNHRHQRREPTRSQSALVHRGPGAHSAPHATATPLQHAPNAALLIDFDNVTMGIRSDLGKELRNLLGSDIIKGKVAVQRAYADWRRYPQYIVPLSEASIDLIFAPAYGSSKKNATDIRLAIDALELVFTRTEIGTFILLSGDSDFSSLVIKLKEYGKYVIGVGIRESSSDLLVQNCDEYYSYNALAGLIKSTDDEPAHKYDPWELVKEAIARMKQNDDVMRSDRLKQVMQEIDPTFDEKNLGISKFSKFCQEAAAKGLLTAKRLENGQFEVAAADGAAPAAAVPRDSARAAEEAGERGARRRRGGRGRGGKAAGGGRERAAPGARSAAAPPLGTAPGESAAPAERVIPVGSGGERLTMHEAFALLRRTVDSLTEGDGSVSASAVRERARELLGRDSDSLSDRNFTRILKDAHDADVVDLRRRGDDFEVARSEAAPSVGEQLAKAQPVVPPRPTDAGASRQSLRGRGAGRGRPTTLPPELLSIGVVGMAARGAGNGAEAESTPPAAKAKRGRAKRGKTAAEPADAAAKAAAKRPRRPRAKKAAKGADE